MNIIIINHYAGSPDYGMEYRPYFLAKEWKSHGHQVMIIASNHSHLRKRKPIDKYEIINGITYRWIRTFNYEGNGVRRLINMFSFVFKLYCFYSKILDDFKPDLIIASSTYPLDIFPARKIASKFKAKLVFEVHDLWPLSPIELGGMSKWHPFILLMQFAENYAYKYSDKVVSLLPCAKDHMIAHGLKPDKFIYVPNGVDVEDWENSYHDLPESHKNKINEIRKKFDFIVGYAGAHGIANSLQSLINSACLLKEKNVAFILIGPGPEKENLEKMATELNLHNVFFLPAISKTSINSLLQTFDLAYIGLQKQSLFRFGISPNKLMDYMMSSRPIVCAISAGNDPVSEANCGITVEPDNSKDIAEAILKLLALPKDVRKELGNNGKKYLLQNHDYKILALQFLHKI